MPQGEALSIIGTIVTLGSAAAGIALAVMQSSRHSTEVLQQVMEGRASQLSEDVVDVLHAAQEHAQKKHTDLSPDDLSERDVLETAVYRVLISTENDSSDGHIPKLSDQINNTYEPREKYEKCQIHFRYSSHCFIASFIGGAILIGGYALGPIFNDAILMGFGTVTLFLFGMGVYEFVQWARANRELGKIVEKEIFPIDAKSYTNKYRHILFVLSALIFLVVFLGIVIVAIISWEGLANLIQ